MVRFSNEEGRPFAEPPPPQDANIPWRAWGAPPDWPQQVTKPETPSARLHDLIFHARSLARMVEGPAWEICADASGGLLAVGIALAKGGSSVALGSGLPGPLTASAINQYGLHLSQRETSDPFIGRKEGSRGSRIFSGAYADSGHVDH